MRFYGEIFEIIELSVCVQQEIIGLSERAVESARERGGENGWEREGERKRARLREGRGETSNRSERIHITRNRVYLCAKYANMQIGN